MQLQSPIANVSDRQWNTLVSAVRNNLSQSKNELGCFGIKLKRLEELGYTKRGKWVYWASRDQWLRNPIIQYRTFCKSMLDYSGRLANEPDKSNYSQHPALILAKLHLGGVGLLQQGDGKLFPRTKRVLTLVESSL